MKIGLSRPYADPGHPTPDVDMGAICQIAEGVGFQWASYGHHTIRPLDEPVLPPHYGVPLYQDPLIGAARGPGARHIPDRLTWSNPAPGTSWPGRRARDRLPNPQV